MRQHARARGETAWIDAGPSRAHIAALVQQGIGIRQIALLARVSSRTVRTIAQGRPRITKAIEARILQVKPIPAGGVYVNGYKAYDLIRLLLKEGYSEAQLMLWLDVGRDGLYRRSKRVRAALAMRVVSLYRRLTAE